MEPIPPTAHSNGRSVPRTAFFTDPAGVYAFTLDIGQQPVRARASGYSGNDISTVIPPPCVRLGVLDMGTFREADIHHADVTYLVCKAWICLPNGEVLPSNGNGGNNAQEQGLNEIANELLTVPNLYMSSTIPESEHIVVPVPPSRPFQSAHSSAPIEDPYQHIDLMNLPHTQSQLGTYGVLNSQRTPNLYQNPYPHNFGLLSTSRLDMAIDRTLGASSRAYKILDPWGHPGIWFVFPSLSIPSPGLFRLKFDAYKTEFDHADLTGMRLKFDLLATAYSEVFRVYPSHRFPGKLPPTDMGNCFQEQGVLPPPQPPPPVHENPEDNDDLEMMGYYSQILPRISDS